MNELAASSPRPAGQLELGAPHTSGRDFDVHLLASEVVKVARPDPSPELTRQRERQLENEHLVLTTLARDRRARSHVPAPGALTRLPDGRLALIRPRVEGTSLADLVERALVRRRFQGARRWNAPTRQLAHAVLQSVDALHRAGYVHNDLKPEDILIQYDGDSLRAVLIDLGLAAKPGRSGSGGTLVWAAPERLVGRPGTPASDVWSLGAILYLLFTGRPPYPEGEDGLTNAVDAQLARKSPLDRPRDQAAVLAWQDLVRHGDEVGVDLAKALSRATDPDPRRRPSLKKLARALGLGAAPPRRAPPPTLHAQVARPTRLAPPIVTQLIALVASTALGLTLALGPAVNALGLAASAPSDPLACEVVRERATELCRNEPDPRTCIDTLTRTDDCRARAALLGACGGG